MYTYIWALIYAYTYTIHVEELRTSKRRRMFGKFREGNPCLFDIGSKTST